MSIIVTLSPVDTTVFVSKSCLIVTVALEPSFEIVMIVFVKLISSNLLLVSFFSNESL